MSPVLIPSQIGPYAISRELGRGGMGIVYAGQHQELGRWAAIKVLLEAGGPDAQARFQRECESLARLDHPGIVRIYDSGFFQNRPFLALEFVEGEPLDEVLAKSGPLEQRLAAETMVEVCEAIAHAHDLGILHRDLKPANLLWDATRRPRVTDFGLAKDLTAQSLTTSGTMLGTPAYMPPEQAAGERQNLGPAADVYGLGATLFALLTGVAPFQGETAVNIVTQVYAKPAPPPSSLDPNIDPELDALVLRCLAKEPQERYPDARALAAALRAFLAGEATDGAPPRKGRPLLLIGAAALVICAGLGVVSATAAARPRATPTPDPAELAQRAGRALRSARSAEDLEAWLKLHAPTASSKDLNRARRRLADERWDEVVAAYGVAGGGAPLPPPGDPSRLKHYRAIRAWLSEHAETASPVRSEAASQALLRMQDPSYVLALLPGTLLPSADGPNDHSQDALFLSDDQVLVYGKSPTAVMYDLATGSRRDVLVGEVGAEEPVDLRGVSPRPEGGLRAFCFQAVLSTRPKGPPRLLRLATVLSAKAILPLGDRTLLVGGRRSRHPQGSGGFAALLPNALLDDPPRGPVTLEEVPLEVQVLAVVEGRHGIYAAGGNHDSGGGDGFLARIEIVEGRPRVAETLTIHAAGQVIALSPEQDAVVVGQNRGGALVYALDDRGRIQAERHAILEPKQGKGAAASIGGAAVQIAGLAFLPDESLLISSDIYEIRGKGFLSSWSPAALRTYRTKVEHEVPSTDRVAPTWLVRIPQAEPRYLSLSPGRDLIAIGTEADAVWLQATPRSDRVR